MKNELGFDGKPINKSYLECGLPVSLQESLNSWKPIQSQLNNGERPMGWDGYFCELQSEINCAEVDGYISSEQAWYLREKYLGMKKHKGGLL